MKITKERFVSVLSGAIELLKKKGWTQGEYAKNAEGKKVEALQTEACQFCLLGAIMASGGFNSYNAEFSRFATEMDEITIRLGARCHDWNDAPNRTKEEVIALLEKAKENYNG